MVIAVLESFIERIRNTVNIERAYKDLDHALSQLRQYNDDPESVDKETLDAEVQDALRQAHHLLSFEGQKNWSGLFRELHEYLAKIHMELYEYDEAEKHARAVLEYDRHEGEYLLKQIEAHKQGERLEDFDPSMVDEAEE
ncbi:MAG: hypothetical protein KatS3mg115_0719 [Candidatus Poribacteria bacterium]|nr:MAG: hypothetical protein KatS3mg115_0719 [Candidatus Poribacteria bacterium]